MNRIIKINTNNVEDQIVLYDSEVGGKEIITSRELYGQDRINREVNNAQVSKAEWADKDAGQYGKDMEAKEQEKLDRLVSIQEVMDG